MKAVDDEGVTLVKEIVVDGRVLGGSESRVAWADLAPAAEAELAADWSPEGAKGAVARALAARARGDAEGARRALGEAGEEPLARHLSAGAAGGGPEAEARAAWEKIESGAASSRLSGAAIGRLLRDVRDFRDRHGQGEFAASRAERLDAIEARLMGTFRKMAGIPADAVQFGGHFYRLYMEQPMTWDRAKAFCERQGGHLVTITSREEHDFVTGLMTGKTGNAWMGLNDIRREGEWEWVTGEKFEFTSWGRGEPNDEGGLQDCGCLCVHAAAYGTGRPLWDDEPITMMAALICEWGASIEK